MPRTYTIVLLCATFVATTKAHVVGPLDPPRPVEKVPLLPAALPELIEPSIELSSGLGPTPDNSKSDAGSSADTIQTPGESSLPSKNVSSHTIVPLQVKGDHFLAVKRGAKKPGIESSGIKWGHVFAESLFLLGIEHGYRLLDPKQPYTRQALRGPFFKDWFDTAKTLSGWTDGDSYMINYIGHPVQGAVSGRILIQNDPRSKHLDVCYNWEYGKSRLKAFGFALFYGLQFELGPISEASIGNSQPSACCHHPTSYVDLVITPTVGMGWLVGEDLADRYFMGYLERRTRNRPLIIAARILSNPSRSMANILRIKWPWYRDTRK